MWTDSCSVSSRASSASALPGEMCLARSSSVFCRPARSPTSIPSTIPARPTPTASTSGGISSAATFSSTSTSATMTRPTPAASSSATAVRARAICSSCSCATFWRAARMSYVWTPSTNTSIWRRTLADALSTSCRAST